MHDAVLNSALCASLSAFMVFSRDTDLLDCRVDADKTRTLDQQTNFSVVTGVYCILLPFAPLAEHWRMREENLNIIDCKQLLYTVQVAKKITGINNNIIIYADRKENTGQCNSANTRIARKILFRVMYEDCEENIRQ